MTGNRGCDILRNNIYSTRLILLLIGTLAVPLTYILTDDISLAPYHQFVISLR